MTNACSIALATSLYLAAIAASACAVAALICGATDNVGGDDA